MKTFLSLLAIFSVFSVFGQTQTTADKDLPVDFKEMKHSFGKIKQGTPVTTEFVFTNTGEKPLIIETATAQCGCTTPEYTKSPVLKGKTGTIKVTYNAAAAGQFTKQVTVKFASVDNPVILTINGEVEAKPAEK